MKPVGIVAGCEDVAGANEKKPPKAASKKKQDSTMGQAEYPTRLSGL